MNERTHVDLFTGLAGFSLAARANGVRTIAMCEADARCQAFLSKAWPGVPVWPDVRTFSLGNDYRAQRSKSRHGRAVIGSVADGEKLGCKAGKQQIRKSPCAQACESGSKQQRAFEDVWLLTAGVPCQPASRAGKQGGASDDRWLWGEACKVFAAIRPAWGLFENPPGIGDVGLAGILSDVEAQGYATRVFSVGACALGAPHRRMRYWIVCKRLADSTGVGQDELRGPGPTQEERPGEPKPQCFWQLPYGVEGRCGPDSTTEQDLGPLAHSRSAGHQGPYAEPGAERLHPEHPQAEQCGVADTRSERIGRRDTEPNSCAGAGPRNPVEGLLWQNYVWLPCADGKVRRAPDDSFSLVDGLHRSVLGALGNSIVWPVSSQIIQAMIQSEQLPD